MKQRLQKSWPLISVFVITLAVIPSAIRAQSLTDDQSKQYSQVKQQEMAKLSVPKNLIARTVSSSRIDLGWEYPAQKLKPLGFIIYRRKEADNQWYKATVTDSQARSYSDRDLEPRTKYHYRVHAYTRESTFGTPESVTAITLRGYPDFFTFTDFVQYRNAETKSAML